MAASAGVMPVDQFTASRLTSIAGYVAALDDNSPHVQTKALEVLDHLVDNYWPEIADALPEIEVLHEDESFDQKARQQAALLASKVYFHLEEYEEAMGYALHAGPLFRVDEDSQYVQSMIAKCIDTYVTIQRDKNDHHSKLQRLSSQIENSPHSTHSRESSEVKAGGVSEVRGGVGALKVANDSKLMAALEVLVDRMIEKCVSCGEEKQALGVVLEARQLKKAEAILRNSVDKIDLLHYCSNNCQLLISSKSFRQQVLQLVVKLYKELPHTSLTSPTSLTSSTSPTSLTSLTSHYPELCRCLFAIGETKDVALLLSDMLENGENDGELMAYQIAFDLIDFENQALLRELQEHPSLRLAEVVEPSEVNAVSEVRATDAVNGVSSVNAVSESGASTALEGATTGTDTQSTIPNPPNSDNTGTETSTAIGDATGTATDEVDEVKGDNDETHKSGEDKKKEILEEKKVKLHDILCCKAPIKLNLQFLHRSNHTDLIMLDHLRKSVDGRNSILHNALVMAHSLMQAGTTCDNFLRANLDWLGKASNWAKFTATASLGVVHKGHITESGTVLQTYLPTASGGQNSPHSSGGALYALGLIHANHGNESVAKYLLDQLQRSGRNNEVLTHGACLGLGLLEMGSGNQDLYKELLEVLYMDSAVAGEAAAYAIGLVMLGSAHPTATTDLLAYAHETEHEKIIRACSLAVALVMYRREEEADEVIEQMMYHKDALVRYGAMFTIGLAYCGTSNNSAVRALLNASVTHVSDDVRRAAVISLGFVLCAVPKQVPKVINLLCESYNPHVRYAAALSLGITCAGTGMSEAVTLLFPMTEDSVDFVRQAAFMALGLVLMQVTEEMSDKVTQLRAMYTKCAGERHEDVMAKFGAIIGNGILDAGGRNATATFFSNSGNLRREAVVGFLLFSQIWYWYPLVHCLSLALKPTALIGLNKDLHIPAAFQIKCTSGPATLYSYPPPTSKEKVTEKKETITAILSTTAKRLPKGTSSTNVTSAKVKEGEAKESSSAQQSKGSKDGGAAPSSEEKKDEDTSSKEPSVLMLDNPSRILNQQQKNIEFMDPPEARYTPIFKGRKAGFLLLKDWQPAEFEPMAMPKSANLKEPKAPEPFVWEG